MDNKLPLDILIRPARVEDGERILQLKIESIRTLNAPDYTAEQIEAVIESVNYWHHLESRLNEAVFVAETQGQVIGVSSLFNWGVVSSLFVHPHYVRRGVGTRLLRAVENEARKRDWKVLSLTASLTGQPFYQACGYRTVGRSSLSCKGALVPIYDMEKWLFPPTEWEKFLWDGYTTINRTARQFLTGDFFRDFFE